MERMDGNVGEVLVARATVVGSASPRHVPTRLFWNHMTARWESAVTPGRSVPVIWDFETRNV